MEGLTQGGKNFVRFSLEPVRDEKASAAEGRPVFRDVEFVRIQVPGDKQSIIHRPARPDDAHRYPREYDAFKRGQAEAVEGTLLSEWPAVSRSQVEELRGFGVRTVEQLAGLTDGNAVNVGPVLALRQKARDFLEKARGGSVELKLRAELETRDAQIQALQTQMADFMAAQAKPAKSAPKSIPKE